MLESHAYVYVLELWNCYCEGCSWRLLYGEEIFVYGVLSFTNCSPLKLWLVNLWYLEPTIITVGLGRPYLHAGKCQITELHDYCTAEILPIHSIVTPTTMKTCPCKFYEVYFSVKLHLHYSYWLCIHCLRRDLKTLWRQHTISCLFGEQVILVKEYWWQWLMMELMAAILICVKTM